MRNFEDHFSRGAGTYIRHRPVYPAELYTYLASIAPHRRLAWDCGTGNGQAALGLALHFDRVVATDASPDQIALAPPHDRVEYRVARSEDAGLDPRSAALVTVAVAVHWFDFERFYAEVCRVLSPGGLIAVWCYPSPEIEPHVDRIVEHYYREVLADYWPDRFRYVHEHYETLPFPFDELTPPVFTMTTEANLPELLGFLQSWSGTAAYERREGTNPIELIRPQLIQAWGDGNGKKKLHWRLFLRVGRVR